MTVEWIEIASLDVGRAKLFDLSTNLDIFYDVLWSDN